MTMLRKLFALSASCAALAAISPAYANQEVGRVISSQPMVQRVAVPRQVCSTGQVQVPGYKSGAGAAVGAITGGAIGNSMGHGGGKAVATMLGVIGGAILGDQIEGPAPTQTRTVQNCTVQNYYENRVTGYNVVYEYAGKRYQTQMEQDPGSTIALQIAPAGAQVAAANTPTYNEQPIIYQQPIIVQNPPPVYTVQSYTVQPYYPPTYYPSVRIDLGRSYHGGGYGWHGHHHRH